MARAISGADATIRDITSVCDLCGDTCSGQNEVGGTTQGAGKENGTSPRPRMSSTPVSKLPRPQWSQLMC